MSLVNHHRYFRLTFVYVKTGEFAKLKSSSDVYYFERVLNRGQVSRINNLLLSSSKQSTYHIWFLISQNVAFDFDFWLFALLSGFKLLYVLVSGSYVCYSRIQNRTIFYIVQNKSDVKFVRWPCFAHLSFCKWNVFRDGTWAVTFFYECHVKIDTLITRDSLANKYENVHFLTLNYSSGCGWINQPNGHFYFLNYILMMSTVCEIGLQSLKFNLNRYQRGVTNHSA